MSPPEQLENESAERVLVVLPTWVGDFVMATPTLRAIRRRFSGARITFLAVPNLAGVIEPGPWADELILWPRRGQQNGVGAFLDLARRLKREAFDLGVLLPNSFRAGLIVWLSGATRRVGYDRDGRRWFLTDRLRVPRVGGKIEPHPICDYYGRIAERLGCPVPGDRLELFANAADESSVDARLLGLGIDREKPLVVISPGASFGASKLWLAERFATVGDRLIAEARSQVLITCGPGEEGIARNILGSMKEEAFVLCDPLLTLGELKALIKRTHLLLCNDAGPRHIAKAFDVPVVTVFGPTHQAWTDTNYPLERKISIPVDCGPCQKKVCPLGHHDCMTGVSVEMVFEACAELLTPNAAIRHP